MAPVRFITKKSLFKPHKHYVSLFYMSLYIYLELTSYKQKELVSAPKKLARNDNTIKLHPGFSNSGRDIQSSTSGDMSRYNTKSGANNPMSGACTKTSAFCDTQQKKKKEEKEPRMDYIKK